MNKIQKLSRFFKRLFWVFLVGWPIVLAIIWFGNQQAFPAAGVGLGIANFIPDTLMNNIFMPISVNVKIWGFIVSFIPMAIGMTISYLFIKLFASYEKGEIFTTRSITYIKKIGIVLLISVLVSPIYQAFISYVITLDNPPGHHIIAIAIGAGHIRDLITAGLVFLIAHIMQEALKLREEQALTV